MKYVGLYSDPQDVAVKKNVDAVADRVTTAEGEIDALQTAVDGKVPNTRKVNNKALSADITLTASDVGALASNTTYVSSVDGASGAVTTNAVKTTAQTLTDVQKSQARTNIGAGTSSFSGSYNDLTNKPTIPSKTSEIDNDSGYITAAGAPVQSVNSKTGAVTLTATDVSALPISGGTLTGDLTVGSAQIQTNGYVTGTWLKGTAANHLTTAATKIAVQDSSGWIYHRTASELLSDIGAMPSSTVIPTVPDNLVTYAAGTTVEAVTGVDADTLQGHAASYFATQSGLTAANTSISTNTNNIAELSTKVSGVEGSISGIQTSVNAKLDKSGGTMTGALVAQNNTNYTTKQVRNIIISTAAPSGGSNGDIWIQYTV